MKLKPLHIAIIGVIALGAGIGIPAIFSKKKKVVAGGDPDSGYTGPSGSWDSDPTLPDQPLTPGQALTIADNLHAALDRYGTDEATLIDNLNRCKTKNDLLLVIEKFGKRKYLIVGNIFGLGKEKDLRQWLKADLTKNELASVKLNVFDKLNVPL